MPIDDALESLLRTHAVLGPEPAQQLLIAQPADSPHLIQDVEVVHECLRWSTLRHGIPRHSCWIASSIVHEKDFLNTGF